MENEKINVPVYLLRTLRPEGYFSRFYALISASGLNHREAWEAIEDERAAHQLPEGYTSYESLRAAKSRSFGLLRINTQESE